MKRRGWQATRIHRRVHRRPPRSSTSPTRLSRSAVLFSRQAPGAREREDAGSPPSPFISRNQLALTSPNGSTTACSTASLTPSARPPTYSVVLERALREPGAVTRVVCIEMSTRPRERNASEWKQKRALARKSTRPNSLAAAACFS